MSINPTFTKKLAVQITGGLGNPSKMPGLSYGISASYCKTGSKLRKVAGSVCSKCYACKGHYGWPVVREAHANRLAGISRPEWTASMIFLIARELAILGVPFFRWHDSGDLQSYEHLMDIVEIARSLPDIRFCLPTTERAFIKRYIREHERFPRNLAVRLSATMIDQDAAHIAGAPIGYSTVSDAADPIGSPCRAYTREGKCGNCRKCWDTKKYPTIAYPKH